MSPNFDIANPSASPAQSWALLQNGLAYLFGIVLTGGTITGPDYILDPAGFFMYSGTPTLGNLILSIAPAPGSDTFGNAYPEGLGLTQGQIPGGLINAGSITLTQLSAAITARVLGGITTTISATAPAGAVAGDIWINTSNGNQLEQYNGSAFVAIAWTATDVISAGTINASLIAAATITGSLIAAGTITASNIAANTITASQLAAGIVYAGIVNSTTITGATINGGTFNGTNWIENSVGSFTYSGTPALGNLISAIVNLAGSSDGHSNSYPAGISSILPSGSGTPTLVAQLYEGSVNFGSLAAINFAGGRAPAFVAGLPADGTLELFSGTQGATDNPASLNLLSKAASGNNQPIIQIGPMQLSAPNGAPSGSGIFIWPSSNSAQLSSANGLTGSIPISQTDVTNHTVTGTGNNQLTNSWSIPANDAQVGTVYRITTYGTAIWGSTAQTLNVLGYLNTTNLTGSGGAGTISASAFAASTVINWRSVFEYQVITTGTTGGGRPVLTTTLTANVSGVLPGTAADNTVTVVVGPNAGAPAINTTIANTLEIESGWGSTTGSPTMVSRGSLFERLGP